MAQDLTLRLLGRPQVSQNSEVGYRTLRRKYVVQGSRANFTELDRFEDPLFLAVGTEDDEFTGFHLINQTIQSADNTLEKAYLIRDYAEIKKTWLSESISNNGELGVLTRKYVVLKAVHNLGYGVQEYASHPDSFGNDLQKEPWNYLPNVIQNSEPTYNLTSLALCNTDLEYNWNRLNASVDTSSKGIDVWQVSWVEPLRPKGRPTFTTNKSTGFEVMQRAWHLPKAQADNFLTQVLHPCVHIGSPDETFPDFFVTDYKVVPNNTVDSISTLTLTYTKLKATEFSQSYVQSNDLIKLRKRYAVVRGDDETYGYGDNWAKHPENPDRSVPVPSNPWDYAPSWIVQKPQAPTLDFTSAGAGGFTNTPGLVTGYDDEGNELSSSLQAYLEGASLTSEWLPGSASISKSSGGMDIWTVEWVTHGSPYWTIGTTSTRGGSSDRLSILDFDHKGIIQIDVGHSSQGSTNIKAKTFNFFAVGNDIPDSLAEISGGSFTFSTNTSVHFNLWFTTLDADGNESNIITIAQKFNNAVWQSSTSGTISFPVRRLPVQGDVDQSGEQKVGDKQGNAIEFDFIANRDMGYFVEGVWVADPRGYPEFQGQPLLRMGGRISFTATSRIGTIAGTSNFDATTTQINPLFSSGTKKIWKVAITYVGE